MDDTEAMKELLPELNAVFGERNILFYWGSLIEEQLNLAEDIR